MESNSKESKPTITDFMESKSKSTITAFNKILPKDEPRMWTITTEELERIKSEQQANWLEKLFQAIRRLFVRST